MRILVVEDNANVAEIITRILDPIRERFPKCTITITPYLKEALEIIDKDPPPDVTTLDLTLLDSDSDNTWANVERIEARSPVVIVTGGTVENHKEIAARLNVEVIKKDDTWLTGNKFVLAVAHALTRGQQRQRERIEARSQAIESLAKEYAATAP